MTSSASCGDSYEQCLEDAVENYEDHGSGDKLYAQTKGCDLDFTLCVATSIF